MLKPLFNGTGSMRVGALMSGSGSNLRKIIGYQNKGNYSVVAIFSDNPASNAEKIGEENNIPVVIRDINAFYAKHGKKKSDLTLRPEYDRQTIDALKPFKIDLLAYCGYMSIASPRLVNAFLGVNVHPADLSIEDKGKRKYAGGHAVLDAIKAGEKTISSSTHLVEEEVDGGRLLMISKPIPVKTPKNADLRDESRLKQAADENQERLKKAGDWVIFPKTLEFIAKKRFAEDGSGVIHFDGKPAPKGYRLEE